MKTKLFPLSLIFLAFSCSPISPYKKPIPYTPVDWKKETKQEIETTEKFCMADWWKVFNDPLLTELEEIALKNNQTLKAAIQNYMQARAQAEIARSYLYPSVFFQPAFLKREGVLGSGFNNMNGPLNKNAIAPSAPSELLRGVFPQYTLPLNINYQVDLWSEIRNGYNAALYTEEAALMSFNSILLSITTDLADNYFILRSLDSEREVLEESQRLRKNAVEINEARYDAGIVNYTDVSRAITEYADVNADYQDMLRQRSIQENMIATLAGFQAPEFSVDFSPLHVDPPLIPPGIPASVLAQRPDIRERERLIAAAWSNIAVAYASYLPSLDLAGSIGFSTPVWSNLLDWKSRFWSYTVSISQMIFDGGAVSGNVELEKARYLQNLGLYEQNVLVAFQEVEDALAGIKYLETQASYLVQAVDAAKDTLDLSQDRYDRGIVTYLDVVDAERTLLDSQRAYVRVFGARYASTVHLIRALGGSF